MEAIEPTVTTEELGRGSDGKVYRHPAFGVITMTTPTGGRGTLFGSDLGHNQRVCIKISAAKLRRDLYRDWIFSQNQIIEFEMSHAQFAQFITSGGNGSGTPVTITWKQGEGLIPPIKNIETKHETQREEVRECAERSLEYISAGVAKLLAMLDSGKIGKRELNEIVRNLEINMHHAPANLAFAVKSAEEALEKATSDAKIEVESYVQMTVQRLGLKHINELAQLEKKEL